ncbi:MAG: ATP synthase subunit a [Parcubacteria group bacterium GW2011_GWC1_41_7]|nr:MAG: ATP synthase subunit a [Parcubacteria group bacterium GW2011_GWC1_41_7]
MNIEFKPEIIFFVGKFGVTNSLLASTLAVGAIFLLLFLSSRKFKEVPGTGQSLLEMLYEGFFNFYDGILTDTKKTKFFFPVLFAFFFFIVVSNWMGILPGVGSILVTEHGKSFPLIRSTFSDLNMTLTLGLIAVIGTNAIALWTLKMDYVKKFINIIGPLEIFGELAKILSFSLRLFGNIFAGEVLLTVISVIASYGAPIPFLGLEIFVGFVQALIFTTLTTIFLKVALSHDH